MDTCIYCGHPFGPDNPRTRDHIVPKVLGLNLGQRNIVRACRGCNLIKGRMTPDALDALSRDLAATSARLSNMAATIRALMAERGLA